MSYFTAGEAARQAGVSGETIRRWNNANYYSWHKSGRNTLISKVEFLQFLNRRPDLERANQSRHDKQVKHGRYEKREYNPNRYLSGSTMVPGQTVSDDEFQRNSAKLDRIIAKKLPPIYL
jgi:excisionase family DNA binding protein